jgi:hypothetical protein
MAWKGLLLKSQLGKNEKSFYISKFNSLLARKKSVGQDGIFPFTFGIPDAQKVKNH